MNVRLRKLKNERMRMTVQLLGFMGVALLVGIIAIFLITLSK